METRNLDIADYLNIWRGALYSVIIGMFIKQFIDNDPTYLYCWIVFIMLTIYVILDSSVRFYSRFLLKKTYLKKDENEPYYLLNNKSISFSFVEFLLFSSEIVGLIIIAFGIKFIQKDGKLIDFIPNDIILSLFLLTVIIHNSIQIGIASNIKLVSFIKTSIFGDALEINSVRKNWQQKFDRKISDILETFRKIVANSNSINEIDRIKSEALTIKKSEKSFINNAIKFHMLAQFSTLHILVFNSIFLFLLFFKSSLQKIIKTLIEYFNSTTITNNLHIILIIISIILFCISYISYKKVANYELRYIKDNPNVDFSFKANNNSKNESKAQLIGNLALIFSLVSIYLAAIVVGSYFIYSIIFFQQMFTSLYIITSNK